MKSHVLIFCVLITVASAWKLIHFQDEHAICNDATASGYYLHTAQNASFAPFLVYLQGGGLCYDDKSCQSRPSDLVSSKDWPDQRVFGGILSDDDVLEVFNILYVPYCTSDLYSGDTGNSSFGFVFYGSYIVPAVINVLQDMGATNESLVFLMGGSAGGAGTLMNYHKVKHVFPRARMAPDAGWFINFPQFDPAKLSIEYMLRAGLILWSGKPPAPCMEVMGDDAWQCYFGHVVYPYLTPWITSPFDVMVFVSLTDEWSLSTAGIQFRKPLSASEVTWVKEFKANVTETFKLLDNVYSAYCVYHTVLLNELVYRITINGTVLGHAFKEWIEEIETSKIVDSCDFPNCDTTCKI